MVSFGVQYIRQRITNMCVFCCSTFEYMKLKIWIENMNIKVLWKRWIKLYVTILFTCSYNISLHGIIVEETKFTLHENVEVKTLSTSLDVPIHMRGADQIYTSKRIEMQSQNALSYRFFIWSRWSREMIAFIMSTAETHTMDLCITCVWHIGNKVEGIGLIVQYFSLM